jgi:hypothetical protein
MCHAKEAGVLWSSALPGLYGIMWSRDLPPLPSQATWDSVFLQLSRGMNLDSGHLVDSRAAKSGICGYRTVYLDIVLYFSSSNTISWNTAQMVYLLILIVDIFSVD